MASALPTMTGDLSSHSRMLTIATPNGRLTKWVSQAQNTGQSPITEREADARS